MKTKIKTIHEENFSNTNKNIGVLYNYSIDDNWSNTLTYYYNDNMYIFFHTIIDLINYLLYGEKKMNRAYMNENTFDEFYDAEYINGKFEENLKWVDKT
ncbi:MAG TPA: hypothetical protein PLN85_00340 [archaeon]|nr:hypothetical protein [archaeon]